MIKNLIAVLLSIPLLISCATKTALEGAEAILIAPDAENMVLKYLADNATATAAINGPIAVLKTLRLTAIELVDGDLSLREAFEDEELMSNFMQSRGAWQTMVKIVVQYNAATEKPIPEALTDYSGKVNAAYIEIRDAYQKSEKLVKATKYLKLLDQIIDARESFIDQRDNRKAKKVGILVDFSQGSLAI